MATNPLLSFIGNAARQGAANFLNQGATQPVAPAAQPAAPAALTPQQEQLQRFNRAYYAYLANPDMPLDPSESTGTLRGDQQALARARAARMLAAGQSAVAERAAAQGRTLQTAPDGTQFYGAPDPTRAIGNYRVRPSGLMEDQVQTLPTGELALYDRTGRLVGTTARVESLSDRYDPKDVDSFGNPKRLPMDAIDRRAFNEGRGTASEREAFGSALIDTVRNQMESQPRNQQEAARWETRGRAMQAMRRGLEPFNRQFADQGAQMTPTGGFVMTPMAGATAPTARNTPPTTPPVEPPTTPLASAPFRDASGRVDTAAVAKAQGRVPSAPSPTEAEVEQALAEGAEVAPAAEREQVISASERAIQARNNQIATLTRQLADANRRRDAAEIRRLSSAIRALQAVQRGIETGTAADIRPQTAREKRGF